MSDVDALEASDATDGKTQPGIDPYQPRLFDLHTPHDASGKSIDSLRLSRNKREAIVRMFDGVVPASVMLARKRGSDNDPANGSYVETFNHEYRGTELWHTGFAVSGAGVKRGALSMFPRNICRAMVLLYSEPEHIIVDPFAGHNSRMETCVMETRHYHGYDVSRRFMEYNFELAEQLRAEFGMTIELFEDDSRMMQHTSDEYGDFTITSPPYWNIEDYGDEPEQLGKLGGYESFLEGLAEVAKQNYRTLKPGAFSVWFVNDFRRKGRFYAYHVDTLRLLEAAGFIHWDMLIVDMGTSFREIFAQQIVEMKILPKRHEYGLVMRKPGWSE